MNICEKGQANRASVGYCFEKEIEVILLVFGAMIGGMVACLMTACVAGMFLH